MKRLLILFAFLAALAGVEFFVGSRPPSALRAGFDKIEMGMSMVEVEGLVGPCEGKMSGGFPWWVDGASLYDSPEAFFCLSWTDYADTILIVFTDDLRVVKKVFYPGKSGARDFREPWHKQIKDLLGL